MTIVLGQDPSVSVSGRMLSKPTEWVHLLIAESCAMVTLGKACEPFGYETIMSASDEATPR